jgi:hypothetical protein
MAANRPISGCNGPYSLRGGRGCEEARAGSATRETHSIAPTPLETPRRWHSFISVPLRGASSEKAKALLGGGSQAGGIGAGCNASRPTAHAGDVAHAGRGRSVGSGGAFGDDGGDAGADLRASPSEFSGEGSGGLMTVGGPRHLRALIQGESEPVVRRVCAGGYLRSICAKSVPGISRMVGVIGFEPTTPSSRTVLPLAKSMT